MRPTLRQLEYIVAVARLGQFGLAAEALNVSQPSLSAQISAVEEDLGTRLFKRGRAGAQPTAMGAEVIRRSQRILGEVDDLRAAVTGGVPFGGRLRLGVLPSIGPYLLPKAVSAIHRTQPSLRVIVREENTRDLEQGLKAGRFDMIISTPEDHPNTHQVRLFNERLWIAAALDDPLAEQAGPVDGKSLRGRNFLTLDSGHRLSRIVYALASGFGGVVADDYEGTSLDSIRLMAASGAGIAVLPELYTLRQPKGHSEVIFRPLAAEGASRDIALLQRAGEESQAGTGFVSAALLDVAREFGLSTGAAEPAASPDVQ
ncbi:hydrogen peroxide-inducible genes activator [Leisingera sp. ANG-S5]|uniref:hydrogen peroxide-inducible genes activator n=1 Tax=Leisingera sp. ANG-S5 TaxID=1577901 RepID=UPI00068E3A12|nr:hydrogen peroxide-inducible genes activator [Leisingera sp. ANG-S5]